VAGGYELRKTADLETVVFSYSPGARAIFAPLASVSSKS